MSKLTAIPEIIVAMVTDVWQATKESDHAVLALMFLAGLGAGVLLSWLL
jgi:hypothetical protein